MQKATEAVVCRVQRTAWSEGPSHQQGLCGWGVAELSIPCCASICCFCCSKPSSLYSVLPSTGGGSLRCPEYACRSVHSLRQSVCLHVQFQAILCLNLQDQRRPAISANCHILSRRRPAWLSRAASSPQASDPQDGAVQTLPSGTSSNNLLMSLSYASCSRDGDVRPRDDKQQLHEILHSISLDESYIAHRCLANLTSSLLPWRKTW